MTKTHLTLISLACALALSACGGGEHDSAETGAHASSSAGLPKGNIEAGLKLATSKGKATGQACVDCHGAEGNAPIAPIYPKLGGQYADYLGHALQAYRSGTRGGNGNTDLMGVQAKDLTDQQIADLSAYFASVNTKLRDLQDLE